MMKMKKSNANTTARCPVTGQVGICPSQAFGSAAATTSKCPLGQGPTPKEQQAHLWQSLLERNGHVPRSAFANNSKLAPSGIKTLEDAEDSSMDGPPGLVEASRASFSLSSDALSDDDSSLSSGSQGSKEQQQRQRAWPTYDQVSAHVLVADYRESLTSGADQHAPGTNTKLLCPHGVVCQARMEFFDAPAGKSSEERYTGLLTPGSTVEHCLLRLSSALRPVDNGGGAWAKAVARRTFGPKLASSQILPAAAIKCFRDNGKDSGNILFMGSKVGQPNRNFFQHALCTAVTEKIPAIGLPFLRRFSRYSKYPLSLGLSEVCQYNAQGEEISAGETNFPFALCLQPVAQMNNVSDEEDQPFDSFIEDIPREVAPGTHLFDIFAAPTPESVGESHQLQRIGRVVSTSNFIYSSPTDGLTFRHQVKEDDLQLRSDWENRMHNHIVKAPDGTKGTSAKLTGWQIFEDNIKEHGDFVDFENAPPRQQRKAVSFAPVALRLAKPTALRVDGWNFCGYKKAQVKIA